MPRWKPGCCKNSFIRYIETTTFPHDFRESFDFYSRVEQWKLSNLQPKEVDTGQINLPENNKEVNA